jgi:site-specific DNA-methyltransferase (adenine-specific)
MIHETLAPGIEIYNADCLDVMREMEDGSVDLVFTSPPYNLGNAKKGSFYAGKDKKGDTISYDLYDDDMDAKDYEVWQHKIINELYRIIKSDGAIFYNHKPRVMNGVYDDRRNLIPLPVRQEIVWDRCGMHNFSGSFYAPNTERIFIIAKDDWKPQREYLRWGEVWRIPPETDNPHPAPFPLRLAKRVIVSASEKGDIVYDPFLGSATTAIASIENGRQFVGSEIDPDYYAIAKRRIEEALMQPRLL